MITNFIIVQKETKSENMPNRLLQAKDGDKTHYIGVGWVKKNQNGDTYLSCAMSKNRATDDGEKYDGYIIITEDEYNFLKNCEARCEFLTSPTKEFPNGIDMAKHPLNSETEQKEYDRELSDIGF